MKKLIILSLFAFLVLSQLVRAEITTDKGIYKPGETVYINLSYAEPLVEVEVSIIDPNGGMLLSEAPMTNISSSEWGYNYTLSNMDLNGNYIINVTALQGTTVVNASMPSIAFQGNFDVSAWNVSTNLNKDSFIPGETMNFAMLITDKYSDSLTFKVFYSITNPQGNEIEAKNFGLSEVNKGFTDVYQIPFDYPSGMSTINITLVDSDGRILNTSLVFSVSKALIVNPDIINETVTETLDKTFEIDNFKDYDVNIKNIEVPYDLKNILSIVQKPYSIQSNGNATMRIIVTATNMTEGFYSGVINISTDEDTIPLYVYLEIMPSNENTQGIINYSYIIWYFAIGIVAVIIALAILRHRKISKKKKDEKKKQEEKKEVFYPKTQEEYRTEYY